jgi:hypothetical protein
MARNGKAYESIEECARFITDMLKEHLHVHENAPLTFTNACDMVKYYGGEDAINADSDIDSARKVYVEKKNEEFVMHVPKSWFTKSGKPKDSTGNPLVIMQEFARVLFRAKQWSSLPDGIIDRFGGIQDEDVKAAIFARGVVMPYRKFLKSVFESTLNGTCNTLKVAKRFGVHYDIALQRGIDLNLWSA